MPSTAEGKAISAKNSFKHGLAAAQLYIPEHLRPLYDEISEDFTETLKPEGLLEQDACKLLCDARFQMERVKILQSSLTNTPGIDPMNDPACRKDYDRLERYYKEAHSRYRANLRELRTLQCERANRAKLSKTDAILPLPLANIPQILQNHRTHKRWLQNEYGLMVKASLLGHRTGNSTANPPKAA